MIQQPWMQVAVDKIGLKEIPGTKNNPEILSWAQMYGGWIADFYNKDSIPWCGLFVGYCMMEIGIKPRDKMLRALDWLNFGIKLKEPCFGAIMCFTRDGGGHVGFYIGEDSETFHILGGNQSDSVNITRVSKSRYKGCVWPPGMENFLIKGRIYKTFSGKISTNEA